MRCSVRRGPMFRREGLVRQAGNIGCPICSASAAVWSTLETGAPVLAYCAVAFDCCVVDVVPAGTYDVLFCRAVPPQRSDSVDNLIYFGCDYHVVPAGLA
jgi:hypothetical protein